MKRFLERVISEQDKIKKQAALNCARNMVIKQKRFDFFRLLFTMLFGQATILIAVFTAISHFFEESDWLIMDRFPLFKNLLIELSGVTSKWYLEALLLLAIAFLLPILAGWIVAFPLKLLPGGTKVIRPDNFEYEKIMYTRAQDIETRVIKDEIGGAMTVMILSSAVCGIASAACLAYSELYVNGEFVSDNLFGVLFGAILFLAFVSLIMYGLNFLLYLFSCIFIHSFENDRKTLNRVCVLLEREWLKKDRAESERRAEEKRKAEAQKQLEQKRIEAERREKEKLSAEAAVWAYQNNYTPDIYGDSGSGLTEEDHDDLDSLTEAMGFDTDVSDM